MLLKYKNKELKMINCNTFFSRLKGFMFSNNINHALLFNNCNSIHTFFMKQNIDVIMCNKENEILYYFNNVPKNRIIFPKKSVYKTIELPVNYFDIKIKDKLTILNYNS